MNLKYILLLPILEIILFVLFGDYFGFFPVLSSIFLTGIFGLYLLRSGIDPKEIKEIASNPRDWIYKKIAGLLLIIPGFATDLIGIIILFRSLRHLVWGFIPEKAETYFYKNSKEADKEEVIEGDYKDLDEK